MAGGGSGGHVIPALAVARELRQRGHEVFFIGTERGLEARLVPAEGFSLEKIQIGGLKRVGMRQTIATLWQLPAGVFRSFEVMRRRGVGAVFSMGGYVAGPPVLAAVLSGRPLVIMEPNAIPGFTNRWIGRFVSHALISFSETARFFPPGRTDQTGVPVREEFFALPPRQTGSTITVLITGGSQGSRTLNRAARESWPLFRDSGLPVRLLHQTGRAEFDALANTFAESGVKGDISAFIADMPAAFAAADLVVCRAGAGAVAEVAAAGKPSVLVPFPFAADQHQLKNAQAFERAGAALLVTDDELTGMKLFEIVRDFASEPSKLERMGAAARGLARPGAARKAAEILEQAAAGKRRDIFIDSGPRYRNNNE